jgi:hypothetical protein
MSAHLLAEIDLRAVETIGRVVLWVITFSILLGVLDCFAQRNRAGRSPAGGRRAATRKIQSGAVQ